MVFMLFVCGFFSTSDKTDDKLHLHPGDYTQRHEFDFVFLQPMLEMSEFTFSSHFSSLTLNDVYFFTKEQSC